MIRFLAPCAMRLAGVAAFVAGSLTLPAAVYAQAQVTRPEDGPAVLTLPELPVTARRQLEPLADVPASVAVVRPQDPVIAPLQGLEEVTRRVPNVAGVQTGNPRQNFVSIRGVGVLGAPLSTTDSTVGYALNGAPISLFGSDTQLLDVERVEVLRGPQGTLFGRNSLGGTINIVPRTADGVRQFTLGQEFGERGLWVTEGIAGGRIAPGLDGRAAVRLGGQDGYIRNQQLGSINGNSRVAAARGSVRYQPTGDTDIILSGQFDRDRRDTPYAVYRDAPGFPAVRLDTETKLNRDLYNVQLEVRHRLSWAEIVSLTNWQRWRADIVSDPTDSLLYAPATRFPASFFERAGSSLRAISQREDTVSQELRLQNKDESGRAYTVGLNYFRSAFGQNFNGTDFLSRQANGFWDTNITSSTVAGFGNVSQPLGHGLAIEGGVRIAHDWIGYDHRFRNNGTAGLVPNYAQDTSVSDTYATGKLGLSWKPEEGSLLWVSAARGYASGGYPLNNTNAPIGRPLDAFKPSTAWTYEVGGRTELLDRRLRIDAAMFYSAVKDGHVTQANRVLLTSDILSLDYETYGFEAQGAYRVLPGLDVFAGIGFNNPVLRNVPTPAPAGAVNGARLPNVPYWTASAGVAYTRQVDAGPLSGTLNAQADLQYNGNRSADVAATFRLRDYEVVNARIGYRVKGVEVAAFARNLLDQKYETNGINFGNGVFAVGVARGRTVGGQVRVDF